MQKDFIMTITNPHPEDYPNSEKECNIRMRWIRNENCWWSMIYLNYDQTQLWKVNAVANKLQELCRRGRRYSIEFVNSMLSFKLKNYV